MSEFENAGCAVTFALLSFVLGVVLGGCCGAERGVHREQEKAIEAGVGRWTVDPQTGEREFRYGVSE